MDTNKELDLAYNFINYTDRNLFLTGKAGTGKTTFLRRLKSATYKRMVVLAPTGVAAINAGGVTIHSFFQLPFGPILPEQENSTGGPGKQALSGYRFTRRKIDLIRSLDLLIIDEISMVRADLLDGIDRVMRKYRNRFQPFGGVQLLMIGDLQQLPPVVKNDEWELLKAHYNTMFFFGSKAFQQARVISIELKQIFRQNDESFIRILNEIREDCLTPGSLSILNRRFKSGFNPPAEEGYIRLSTHNSGADKINRQELEKLKTTPHRFDAEVTGNFPEIAYPTFFHLVLKVGAQVMFVKNDSSADKRYYNGKIGTISEIDDGEILVQCPGETEEIPVNRVLWNNIKYVLNEESKELEEKTEGSFLQYPLRLAWAITIHKSQGLTFERAIIDAQAAFAHGQTYVALSRCKTMEGLVLSSPLSGDAVICDRVVNGFNRQISENQPGDTDLLQSKKQYQLALLDELFNFKPLNYQLSKGRELLQENEGSVLGDLPEKIASLISLCVQELIPVSEKFIRQVYSLAQQSDDVETNPDLQERIIKACGYYAAKMNKQLKESLSESSFETDNFALKKDINDRLGKIREIIHVKLACCEACQNGLKVKDFLATRAKALLADRAPEEKTKFAAKHIHTLHPELYRMLLEWRNKVADERELVSYQVLTQKALIAIVNELPRNSKELLKLPGIGKKTIQNYGKAILNILAGYVATNKPGVEINVDELPAPAAKIPTRDVSFALFRSGKSIPEIARERDMATSTIEGHLAHFVGTGELDIAQVVPEEKIKRIGNYLRQNPEQGLKDCKDALGETVSYTDLKFVMQWLRRESVAPRSN